MFHKRGPGVSLHNSQEQRDSGHKTGALYRAAGLCLQSAFRETAAGWLTPTSAHIQAYTYTYISVHNYTCMHPFECSPWLPPVFAYTNQRHPLSIYTTHSPYIILTTRDHYRGFKSPIRHFNSISSPWHFVWGKLKDVVHAKQKNLDAGAMEPAMKVDLMTLSVPQFNPLQLWGRTKMETWRLSPRHWTFLITTSHQTNQGDNVFLWHFVPSLVRLQ